MFSVLNVEAVWSKGHRVADWDPNLFLLDDFGNVIYRHAYGDRSRRFGWEIDHIIPESRGGSDHISNLRPLHWRKNASLGGLLAS